MSFSYSNGVITQTGTDTNLSGLNGISGVTINVSGQNTATYKIYTLNSSTRLIIDGTLTIDPEIEQLVIAKKPPTSTTDITYPCTVNGSLILGKQKTGNNNTSYSSGVTLNFTGLGDVWWRDKSLSISSGGSFTMYGSTIRTGGSLIFNDGCSLLVEKGEIYNVHNSNIGIRFRESSGILRKLTFDGRQGSDIRISINDGIAEANLILKNAFYYTEVTPQSDILFTNYDVSLNINTTSIRFEDFVQDNLVEINNASNRLNFVQSSSNGNRDGYCRVFRVFNVPITDLNNNPITYSYYGKDINNGNRVASSKSTFDDTADKIYSGINQTQNFQERILWEVFIGINGVANVDDRTDQNDTIPIIFISYNESLKTYNPALIGLNTATDPLKLEPDFLITEANRNIVDAYTELETPEKLYDRAKSYLVSNFVGQSLYATRSGNLINAGSYNVTIDATASTAFDITGNLITIKASTFTGNMVTTGLITLANGAIFDGVRTDANGTVYPDQPISITNISAGSRLRIYNVTTGTETVNTVVSGTSYTSSYQEGTGYNDGDTVRVYLTKLGKQEWVGDVIDTSNGFNVLASQVDDDVYTALGVDGTTITKFQADYVNNEVDLVIGSDWTMAELYAWWANNLTTEDGIRNFFGGITAIDQANFRINTSIVDLYLDNTTNASYKQTDNRRFFRDTGTGYPVRNPTTSGYGLDVVWRNTILIAESAAGGTSDLNFYDVKRAVKQVITNPKYIKGQK